MSFKVLIIKTKANKKNVFSMLSTYGSEDHSSKASFHMQETQVVWPSIAETTGLLYIGKWNAEFLLQVTDQKCKSGDAATGHALHC